ncbi:MAG: hypothetical protein AABZ53_06960, partial [Planctomycetota bacterium]
MTLALAHSAPPIDPVPGSAPSHADLFNSWAALDGDLPALQTRFALTTDELDAFLADHTVQANMATHKAIIGRAKSKAAWLVEADAQVLILQTSNSNAVTIRAAARLARLCRTPFRLPKPSPKRTPKSSPKSSPNSAPNSTPNPTPNPTPSPLGAPPCFNSSQPPIITVDDHDAGPP